MQQNNKLQALLLAGALGRGDICTPTKKKREREWKETTLRTLLIWMQVFHSQTVQKRSRAKWLCLSGKIYCTLGQNGHDGARWLLWNKNSSQKKKKDFISITLNDSGQHNLSWLEIDVQSGILSVGPFFGKSTTSSFRAVWEQPAFRALPPPSPPVRSKRMDFLSFSRKAIHHQACKPVCMLMSGKFFFGSRSVPIH